jgi:hypothetical protein
VSRDRHSASAKPPRHRDDVLALSKNSLMAMGREYWEIYLPGKYHDLLEAGRLRDALACAAEMTLEAMQSLHAGGMSRWDAWQTAGSRHLLLPEEPYAKHGRQFRGRPGTLDRSRPRSAVERAKISDHR